MWAGAAVAMARSPGFKSDGRAVVGRARNVCNGRNAITVARAPRIKIFRAQRPRFNYQEEVM